MVNIDLITPVWPARCCATCRWWVARPDGAVEAWCRVIQRDLPEALTTVVCIAYERERWETFAVELYERLAAGQPTPGVA